MTVSANNGLGIQIILDFKKTLTLDIRIFFCPTSMTPTYPVLYRWHLIKRTGSNWDKNEIDIKVNINKIYRNHESTLLQQSPKETTFKTFLFRSCATSKENFRIRINGFLPYCLKKAPFYFLKSCCFFIAHDFKSPFLDIEITMPINISRKTDKFLF